MDKSCIMASNSSASLHADQIKKSAHRSRKKALWKSIRDQMEFYFSDANLRKDRFMAKEIDKSADGWLDAAMFLNFNKIRKLTENISDILGALQSSTLLEVKGKKIRRVTAVDYGHNTDACTIYVEKLPPTATHESLRNAFNLYGQVVYVSLPKYHKTDQIKGFAFIEFASEEDVERVCKAYGVENYRSPFGGERLLNVESFHDGTDHHSDKNGASKTTNVPCEENSQSNCAPGQEGSTDLPSQRSVADPNNQVDCNITKSKDKNGDLCESNDDKSAELKMDSMSKDSPSLVGEPAASKRKVESDDVNDTVECKKIKTDESAENGNVLEDKPVDRVACGDSAGNQETKSLIESSKNDTSAQDVKAVSDNAKVGSVDAADSHQETNPVEESSKNDTPTQDTTSKGVGESAKVASVDSADSQKINSMEASIQSTENDTPTQDTTSEVVGETVKETEKSKRIRKRKRHKKNFRTDHELHQQLQAEKELVSMVVMTKNEWKRLRNRYLSLQKQTMAQIKRSLMPSLAPTHHTPRHQFCSPNTWESPARPQPDEHGSNEARCMDKSLKFIPGVIVHLSFNDDITQELRSRLRHTYGVKYVDFSAAPSRDVWLRFGDAETAQQFARAGTDGATSTILFGNEEQDYWNKIEQQRHQVSLFHRRNDGRQKQRNDSGNTARPFMSRGIDKIIARAEKSAFQQQRVQHIKFTDDDEQQVVIQNAAQ